MILSRELSDGWMLRLADPSSNLVPAEVSQALPIPAVVPGTVHLDLLREGLVSDPYQDRNEIMLDWIGHADWIYERRIEAPANWFGANGAVDRGEVLLEFDGLDTVATITVNGEEVAQTANMHRRYSFEIGDLLHPGDNELAVRFDSAWRYACELEASLGSRPNQYPAPFPFIRKSACNFGWDWGPTLVTAGIWREARLVRVETASIAEVRPNVEVRTGTGIVQFHVGVRRMDDSPLTIVADVAGNRVSAEIEPGATSASLQVEVPDPHLWWPAGLGEQPLYPAQVQLCSGDVTLDVWQQALGFRTIRLLTGADEAGSEFSIEVNGVRVPIRGANWIPDDCFLPRVTRTRLQERLHQAVACNLNLLRVWGGGVYESEAFYSACDELGLLVWQDFLFACAGYPESDPIRSEVEAEARDNVARLMPHPSLALWNGNNENIWGWFDWNWQPLLQGQDWGLRYYVETLPTIVAEVDPARPYWAGSPYSGSMDIHPNDPDHGCTHIWDVWNTADYTVYRNYRPRFASEFGWQGPATWATITESIRDQPLTPTSPGMLHHQKAEDGNGKLERGLEPHFEVPTDFDDWHFAMQLNQARAVAFGIEHLRAQRPQNQGAIIWQLNDCWPVTSWAAIDWGGRRKPLWFALRSAFAPRLLTVQPRNGHLDVIGVNDQSNTWRETVTIQRRDFTGAVLASYSTRLAADRFGSARVQIPDEVAHPDHPASELLVVTTATGERAEHFYLEDKDLAYPRMKIEGQVVWKEGAAVLTLTAHTLVRDLCIFADRVVATAEADRALITLLPGETARFRVSGLRSDTDPAGLLRTPVLRAANDLVG